MATEINLSKETKEVKELASAIGVLTTDLKGLKAEVLNTQKAFDKQSKSQKDVADKTNKVQTANQKLQDIQKERVKLISNINKANTNSIQKNEELRIQLQNQKKANKDLAREKLGLVGAYEKESKKLTTLRKKYKDLIVAGKGNEKATKALGKQVGALDKKLKGADAQAGQFQRNVGNYPGVMGRAQSSIMSVNMAFKALLANPIVAIIAAIAGAFIGLVKALKRSEEGQNALNKISSVLSATLDVLLDIVTTLAEKIVKAFEDPQQAVKDLWQAIKNNLVNRFEGLIELFVSVGDIGANTFKLIRDAIKGKGTEKALDDLKESAIDAGKAFIKLQTGIEPDKLIKGFKEITKEIANEADITAKLADRQAALDLFIRNSLVRQATLRKEINLAREIAAKKEEISAEDRLEALDRAIAFENELLGINQRIISEKLDIKAIQNALGKSTKEDLNEEAQLRAELIDLEAQAARKRKLLESERVTAVREIQAEEKAFWDEYLKDANDVIDEIEKDQIESQKAITKSAEEEAQKRVEAELEKQKLLADQIKQVRQDAWDAGGQILSDQFAGFIDNNLTKFQDGQDAQEQILKDKLDKGLISEDQYEKKLKTLRLKGRQEEARADKKKALFDIAIATAVEIAKSLSKPFLIPGIIAGGAIQAAVVAARPIPKFKMGTNGKLQMDTAAIVGEVGSELISTPKGDFLSPSGDTMVTLPKGSEVFRHDSPETQAAMSGGMTPEMYKGLLKSNQRIEKAIGSKEIHQSIVTENGYSYIIKKEGLRQKRLDKMRG